MTRVLGTTRAGQEIACWVLKCNPAVYNVAQEVVELGEVTNWSVAENYRKDLMEPGHPCLLWVTGSGSSPVRAGFYAAGTLVEGDDGGVLFLGTYSEDVEPNDSDPRSAVRTFVHCRMRWLDQPILKADLLREHPAFRRSEVIAAAQGSNPRILTPEEYEAVLSFELSPGPVTPEQRRAFAEVHGDALDFMVVVNLPDGGQLVLLEDDEGVVVSQWFADREELGEELFRTDSWPAAVGRLASDIVPRQDEYPITGDEDRPIIAYEVDGHDHCLYREATDEWVEYAFDADGEPLGDGLSYASLADYLEDLAAWDEEQAPSAGEGA